MQKPVSAQEFVSLFVAYILDYGERTQGGHCLLVSMAQEQCINAHMKIEHILMELEDTQAQANKHLEKIRQ